MKAPPEESSEEATEIFPNTLFGAVLFDMDGTLIDSTSAVERSWLAWAKNEGIHPDDFLRAGHGQPAAKLVASAVPPERVAESLKRLTAIEESDTDGIEILPGVRALLDSLPAEQWAIVTSSTKDLAYIRLAAAGVQPPSTVVTFDDVVRGKPDPEPFIRGAQALGVDPSRCLVVEDSVAGLIAGRRAGCVTLAIAGTHHSSELSAHADAIVESFDDLAFVPRDGGLSLVLLKPSRT